MKPWDSFDLLAAQLRTDMQRYLDYYPASQVIDGPILAFCAYFDSENGSLTPIMLAQSAHEDGIEVSDVAAWAWNGEWAGGEISAAACALLEAYNVQLCDDATTEAEQIEMQENFIDALMHALKSLNFDNLNRALGFLYFAQAMDEDIDLIDRTVPASLRTLHFAG